MKFLRNQLNEFHYSDAGLGPIVVLLHGFCENISIWDELVEVLSEKYRVICIDLPGHGLSSTLEQVSIPIMADIVKQILDQERISLCVIIGHSMGGYVAVEFAKKFPSYVGGLGFYHSSAAEETEKKKLERTRLASIVLNNRSGFVKTLIPGLFLKSHLEKFEKEITSLQSMAIEMNPIAISQSLLSMRDRNSNLELIAEIDKPVMFILGKEDIVLPIDDMKEQIILPSKCYAYITTEASHMGFIEDPVNCTNFILTFLEACNKDFR